MKQIKFNKENLRAENGWEYHLNSTTEHKDKLRRLCKEYLTNINYKKMIEKLIDNAYSQTFEGEGDN